MTQVNKIMLVDDDQAILRLIEGQLDGAGYHVKPVASAEQALIHIAVFRPHLVITDLRLKGMDGMALQAEIQSRYPAIPVIIITAHGTIPDAIKATRQGAFDFLTKPFDKHYLLTMIQQALEVHGNTAEHTNRLQKNTWRKPIITCSPLMQDLLGKLQLVAGSDVSVLIHGESGTGKELLAQAIHQTSPRAVYPFQAINCDAIPEHLLESELFGHSKGAFTGATNSHRGLFEAAHRGTLFLDEIGDMPYMLQAKLLRVLQEREVRPVGSTQTIPVDIRVVSATHRNLEQAMKAGTFREDLYYRLNVVDLELPSLQERREDIPLLVRHFLSLIAERSTKPQKIFAPEAMELLVNASWPGNIRQLYNLVEQTAVLACTPIIPASLVKRALHDKPNEFTSLADARQQFERDYLAKLLKITSGNVSAAARMAKRNRTEFYRLLQRHQLQPAQFKQGTADQ